MEGGEGWKCAEEMSRESRSSEDRVSGGQIQGFKPPAIMCRVIRVQPDQSHKEVTQSGCCSLSVSATESE